MLQNQPLGLWGKAIMLHIDVPEHRLLHAVPQVITGWITCDSHTDVPRALVQGREHAIEFFKRADVESVFPDARVMGFTLWIDLTKERPHAADDLIVLELRQKNKSLGEARFRVSRPLLGRSSSPLFWAHIPKTAGTALWEGLARCFPGHTVIRIYEDSSGLPLGALKDVPKQHIEQIELIFGHFAFGIHKYLDIDPPRYATVLRDPIDLLASFLAFSGKIVQTDPFLDNPLVRYLSGEGYDLPHGMIEERHLNAALENLQKHFVHVGFTTRLDETIQWLSARYHVPLSVPPVVNATGKRTPLPLPAFCRVDQDLVLYNTVRMRKL